MNSDGIENVMCEGGTWKENVDVRSETESLCVVQNVCIEKKDEFMPEPPVEIEVDVSCEHSSKDNDERKQDIRKERNINGDNCNDGKNLYGKKLLKIVITLMQISIIVHTKRIIVISVLRIVKVYHHLK